MLPEPLADLLRCPEDAKLLEAHPQLPGRYLQPAGPPGGHPQLLERCLRPAEPPAQLPVRMHVHPAAVLSPVQGVTSLPTAAMSSAG